MKITLTIKTEKGFKSSQKEIDESVDKVLNMGSYLNKKYKDFDCGKLKIKKDGSTLILTKR
ncbi:MAG: hypothetical protein WC781_03340 [Candidatus Pacearchaeota archaeon]|jgi:hypothetical protein